MRIFILILLSLSVLCFVGKYIYFMGYTAGLDAAFKVYPDKKEDEKQR